jgi:hypothetical protein
MALVIFSAKSSGNVAEIMKGYSNNNSAKIVTPSVTKIESKLIKNQIPN